MKQGQKNKIIIEGTKKDKREGQCDKKQGQTETELRKLRKADKRKRNKTRKKKVGKPRNKEIIREKNIR